MKCDECEGEMTKGEQELGDICFKCIKEDLTMVYNRKSGGYEKQEGA